MKSEFAGKSPVCPILAVCYQLYYPATCGPKGYGSSSATARAAMGLFYMTMFLFRSSTLPQSHAVPCRTGGTPHSLSQSAITVGEDGGKLKEIYTKGKESQRRYAFFRRAWPALLLRGRQCYHLPDLCIPEKSQDCLGGPFTEHRPNGGDSCALPPTDLADILPHSARMGVSGFALGDQMVFTC